MATDMIVVRNEDAASPAANVATLPQRQEPRSLDRIHALPSVDKRGELFLVSLSPAPCIQSILLTVAALIEFLPRSYLVLLWSTSTAVLIVPVLLWISSSLSGFLRKNLFTVLEILFPTIARVKHDPPRHILTVFALLLFGFVGHLKYTV